MIRPQASAASEASSKSLNIIAVGVAIALLYFGRQILIPVALAIVLSFLLTPLVAGLQRIRIGRVPSVILALILCLSGAVAVGWGVAGQLIEITSHIHDYRSNLEEKVRSLHSRKGGPLGQATATVNEINKELAVAPEQVANAKSNKEGSKAAQPIPVRVTAPPSNLIQDLGALLGPLAGPLETTAVVIIFVAFMLINREDLRNRLIRLGGQGHLTVMTQALEDASARLSRYLLLQFLVNAGFGLLFGLGLQLIGVPHARLWGLLGGLLRFIPYIGTWIGAAFPVAMAVAVFPGWKEALLAFALFMILELVIANVVEPWLYGSHTGISSLAILIAAVFWATLWGPVGLILSTPLTLCLILAGRYIPQMRFLEVLLGDAPALRNEQIYYQRLLAMDPDEARDVADEYLQDHSVASLYESVLMPALRLAEEDRHTDLLGDRACEFISQTTRELIEDLGEREQPKGESQGADAQGDRTGGEFEGARIVCLPARDDADELVGAMLAQLLRKGGHLDATHLSIGTVDDMLEQVERGGYEVACVSALPPFAVGQARSLCKRLHARFPDMAIVVGLWGFTGGIPKAQERVGSACTDAVSTSLADAQLQLARLSRLKVSGTDDQLVAPKEAPAAIR